MPTDKPIISKSAKYVDGRSVYRIYWKVGRRIKSVILPKPEVLLEKLYGIKIDEPNVEPEPTDINPKEETSN